MFKLINQHKTWLLECFLHISELRITICSILIGSVGWKAEEGRKGKAG
jgi:hypothetical protein